MTFQKVALAAAVALTLAGCGSSSSSSSGSTPAPQGTQYQVIDGYLLNAEVCVLPADLDLAHSNQECVYEGVTDEKGRVTIPEEFAEHTVVARVVAGVSSDSDTEGFVVLHPTRNDIFAK